MKTSMNTTLKCSIIFFSFIVAWLLMIIPMPANLHWLKPEWITLLLIYWAWIEPGIAGVLLAWCIGLMMDVINGSLLGQYALSMSIVVYLVDLCKHQMRVFPLWQQTLVILILVGFGKLSWLMVQWLTGHPPVSLWYWASSFTSMLMWPLMIRLLRFYGRKTL